MPRRYCEIVQTFVFTNQEALESLVVAAELIRDAMEDAPWSETLKEAWEKLDYAAQHIGVADES
ncbi:MAG: hypothetical protein KJ888_20840 [Gammaproteobacteria bacterium]|nr:hypothetical protein [Gammaproteobacteria bacterium]